MYGTREQKKTAFDIKKMIFRLRDEGLTGFTGGGGERGAAIGGLADGWGRRRHGGWGGLGFHIRG